MTRALAIAFCVLALRLSPAGAAGADLRPELHYAGPIQHLGWIPDGNLWFGTSEGQVYVSRDGGHGWSEVPVSPRRSKSQHDLDTAVSGDTIYWVQFFDSQRGLALGWWKGGNQPSAFRTTDGGATWQPLQIPPRFLVHAAQVSPEGRAWLIGDCGIVVSEDYGATWRFLTSPPGNEGLLSVHFSSPSEGFVGTWHSLFFTSDGGASWRRLQLPSAQNLTPKECETAEIRKVRRWGDQLLIEQCRKDFVIRFPESVAADAAPPETLSWQPILVDGQETWAFEPIGQRLLVISGRGEIVYLDRTLQVTARPGFWLRYQPRDIAALGDRIAILDERGNLAVGRDGVFAKVTLLEEGAIRPTPPSEVRVLDRGADGSLWGLSTNFLQRSRDGGRTWERQADLPYFPGGLALRASGEVLLWTREGGALSYDPRTSAFTPVPELRHLDMVDVVRRGPLWLAFGGWQQRTADGKVVRSRALNDNDAAGWANAGFLEISTDGGGHWQLLDNRIEESGVQAVFWGDDNTLTVLTWLGSIYRGKLTVDADGKASIDLTRIFHGSNSFGESVEWLDFLNGKDGWIRGWYEAPAFVLFRSRDGGKSWKGDDLSKRYLVSLTRLDGGTWLAQVRLGRSLVRWDGKRFRSDKKFDDRINETWIDSTGGLVVRLDNEELWALDAAGKHWSRLR